MDGVLMTHTDVAIVGAGPAGIGAALAAASRGASVTIVDENPAAGGHLRWTLARQPGEIGELTDARGVDIARWAERAIHSNGIEFIHGVAWGLFDRNTLAVTVEDRSFQVVARSVIVASGAIDIVTPFPGWDLPGVMTVSAALRMMHLQRVLPGRRVLVVGDGKGADDVVDAFTMAGAEIVARARRVDGLQAGGGGEVSWVQVAGERVDCDCVVIAIGRAPDPELVMQLQCPVAYSDLDSSFVPYRSSTLETSLSRVFAVGDCAGSCGAAEAFAEGTVAGIAAAGGNDIDQALSALSDLRTPQRRSQLERLSLPPVGGTRAKATLNVGTPPAPVIDESTLVCRCEEVSAASIRQAMAEGALSIDDIKRRTRAGMGVCQGVFCSATIRHMLHAEAALDPASIAPMTTRPPARIVPLTALANNDDR